MSPARRDVLRRGGVALLTVAGLSGCSALDESPAPGAVVFHNRLDVPQVVTLRVTAGPGSTTDPMFVAGTSAALDAGERRTVDGVFTEPGTYSVEGWLVSQNPETTGWEPETAEVELRPDGGYAEYLLVRIHAEGGLLELIPTAVG